MSRVRGRAPGFALALVVALVATGLGRLEPVIGGPVFGIVVGIVVGALLHPGARVRPGLALAAGPILKASIVVLGATLSLSQVVTVGLGSLPVMLGTLAVALIGAWLIGRAIGVRGDTQVLIGVGTAICGASAIAAATAVLKPKPSVVAYAIGTIFTFNVIAVLAFPPLGHLFGMDAQSFGLWAGTAINDTSSVVAAGYSFSSDAGPYAVVIKLTRTLTLIPIVIALAVFAARRDAHQEGAGDGFSWRALPWRKLLPVFLLGFLIAATLDTLGVFPASTHSAITLLGTFMITIALAGIGLGLNIGELRATGVRPLLLGAILWVLVALSSLGLQALTGTL
ncbi:MAG: putative sulfate exporter family transporter [Mycobacteriaceae bacterium]